MSVGSDTARLADILSDYSSGLSYRRIAARQGIGKDVVYRLLRKINSQTIDEMRDIILTEIPLQWRSSLVLLRSISETAHDISSDTNIRHEVRLQACKLQMDCMKESNSLMTDSVKIFNALQKVKERKRIGQTAAEHSEANEQTDDSDEDDGQIDGEDLIHTSKDEQDHPDEDAIQNRQYLQSDDSQEEGEVREGPDNEDGAT